MFLIYKYFFPRTTILKSKFFRRGLNKSLLQSSKQIILLVSKKTNGQHYFDIKSSSWRTTLRCSYFVCLDIVCLTFLCRDAPPLYYPESTCSGSLPQKLVIPLVLLVSGLAGGLMPLLPALHPTPTDIAWNTVLPHSCVDPTR